MRPTPTSDLHADIAARLKAYAALMRLNQPVGAYLLLWPTLWALWLASEGRPDEGLFIVFVIGVLVMRSAGCVINDFTDRRIDPYVERTRQRPLASGAVRPSEAVALFVSLGLVAVGLATTLNPLAQLIAAGAAVLTLVYPLIKRHLSVPQLVLGAAFASAVPMAFAAQTGNTPPLAWLTFSATLIWAVIYDTFYAMVDREDDRKIGVKSTAILFGDMDLFAIGAMQAIMLLALLLIGQRAALGPWYYVSLLLAAALMLRHLNLAKHRDRRGCFRAFRENHVIGLVIFMGIVLSYIFDPAV